MMVLLIGQRFLNTKLERLPCHSQVLNMVILELQLSSSFFFIVDERLLLQLFVHRQIRDAPNNRQSKAITSSVLLFDHFLDNGFHLACTTYLKVNYYLI